MDEPLAELRVRKATQDANMTPETTSHISIERIVSWLPTATTSPSEHLDRLR